MMVYKKELIARHPYEERDTIYVFSGLQECKKGFFPMYTADDGEGTTVSLDTILRREEGL